MSARHSAPTHTAVLDPTHRHTGTPGPTPTPVLDVVIPVHNEELDLRDCVRRLHFHLSGAFPYAFLITIVDNASTDRTPQVAQELSDGIDEVRVLRLEQRGRGRALRHAWSSSPSPVLAYMDVDLSTDLSAIAPLVAPLLSGHSDLAIGTRLNRAARVVRGPRREVISRGYNLLLRTALGAHFSDAQCGFKAIRGDVAAQLLPLVQDGDWFFDTELLLLAERAGLRIHEVPVDWVDDPDSRVDVVPTVLAHLRGIVRLSTAFASGRLPLTEVYAALGRRPLVGHQPPTTSILRQLVRFGVIGVFSTAAYLVLFLGLHAVFAAQVANLVALLVTAAANTAANRRLTFGIRGRGRFGKDHAQGLAVFAIGLGLTSGSLALLHTLSPGAGRTPELAVLLAANAAATLLRFLLLRGWVFHPSRRTA